ncbi:hypothetical protein OJAV_G00236100 [Oryzias javanicus]|uniref:Uncharacterized protein n=1 Tax=Oryzias javanicus TaxID=123683 RepID=A0A437BYL9_ORYJA|nr:hypothetical protein OJAV_G00236100 [Oryzias javanicus]
MLLTIMSLFMAAKKKREIQADVHRNQTDNIFGDFIDLNQPEFDFLEDGIQTHAAPMTEKNPAVFSGSSEISPSPGAAEAFSSGGIRPEESRRANSGGSATTATPQPPQRKKHHQQQQRRQTPNPSFPPKQSVQKPPHLQPRPEPQLQTPVPQNTQRPNEDPPLPEARPENQAGAEFQTPGGVQTTSSAKGRRRATALNTDELKNPKFKKARQDPPFILSEALTLKEPLRSRQASIRNVRSFTCPVSCSNVG